MTNKEKHIIVIGNEKGGAGKTTTSIHLITSLLYLGFNVSSFDADVRQKSLSRYLENRANYSNKNNLNLKMPKHVILEESTDREVDQRAMQDSKNLEKLVNAELASDICDFIIIDTPGSNTYLSNYAHSIADTIITPINDSFLDLDVIAHIEADTLKIIKPSFYAQAIWERKMEKAKLSKGEINWIVLRNRLSAIDAKNKKKITDVLDKLSARLGFKAASGFNERVIYRELFLHGLTLLDIKSGISGITLSLSHIAAKQELNNLLRQLNIEKLNQALAELDR